MPSNSNQAKQSFITISIWLRNTVFVSVGSALVIASVLLRAYGHSSTEAVALNLGLVSIAVVVIDQLWRLCGGSPIENQILMLSNQVQRLAKAVDVIESSKAVGLEAVFDRLGNYGNQSDWIDLINNAVDSVDFMGRTMFGWTRSDDFADMILTKIQRDGLSIRWLIMHEENKYLALLTEEHINIGSILSGKLSIVYETLWSIHNRLDDSIKNRFQVRLFSHVPLYCALLRIDDRHYVTQYLFSASSDNSPFYCVKGSDGAWPKLFSKEFSTVWDVSKDFFGAYAPKGEVPAKR
jgi:hypothetical protein